VDGELVYRPLVPGELDGFDSGGSPLLRLAVNGSSGPFGYGVTYQSTGRELEGLATAQMKKDRRGGDVWAEGRLGVGRLRLSLAQYSDNVDEDPGRIQTTRTQGSLTVEVAPPSWPTLRLSYANGLADSRPVSGTEVAATPGRTASLETLGASLNYHGGSSWDLSFSSGYSWKRPAGRESQESTEVTCDVSGTYRPTASITLTPAVSYWEERYAWVRDGMQAAAASLSVGYTPSRVVTVSLHGSYGRTATDTGDVDGSTINVRSSLVWAYGKLARARESLALEVGYDRYLDAVYSGSSTQSLSALVLFRLSPLQ
jgi:hypothetical protein